MKRDYIVAVNWADGYSIRRKIFARSLGEACDYARAVLANPRQGGRARVSLDRSKR